MLYLADKSIIATSHAHNTTKTYTVRSGSYHFSDYDKDILVFHKRAIKVVNLKDIGKKMTIFYYATQKNTLYDCYDVGSFIGAFTLFGQFDEIHGETKHFLYRVGQSQAATLQKKLHQLGISQQLQIHYDNNIALIQLTTKKNNKEGNENSESNESSENNEGNNKSIGEGNDQQNKQQETDKLSILSFLFGLSLIYGTYQAKNDELDSIKIHIPIFGEYSYLREQIMGQGDSLQTYGLLIDSIIQEGKESDILQITINDYEIIEQFAHWHKPIASFAKINKKERADFFRSQIISYLQKSGADKEVISLLENKEKSTIKPLLTS